MSKTLSTVITSTTVTAAALAMLLFCPMLNAAPFVIDSDEPECQFHTSGTEVTTILPCEVAVQERTNGTINVQARYFGEYNPKPASYSLLGFWNVQAPCFVDYDGQKWSGNNFHNVVNPLRSRHVNLTQFYLSCVNLEPYFE